MKNNENWLYVKQKPTQLQVEMNTSIIKRFNIHLPITDKYTDKNKSVGTQKMWKTEQWKRLCERAYEGKTRSGRR